MEFKPSVPNNNLEKQNLWNKWLAKVDKITDGLNYPIDPGIKESVVAFNVLGISTDASCEGHLDRGSPYPWIDVSAISNELHVEFEKGQEIIAKQKYKDEEAFRKDNPELHKKMALIREEYIKNFDKIKNDLNILLNQFYYSHKSYSPEGKITAHEFGNGFRVEFDGSRGLGLGNWARFHERISRLSLSEKEELLKNNQAEMKAFTEFLKKKFFENK